MLLDDKKSLVWFDKWVKHIIYIYIYIITVYLHNIYKFRKPSKNANIL